MLLQTQVMRAVRDAGNEGAFAADVADRLRIPEKRVGGTLHVLTSKGVLRREKARSEAAGKAVWRYWFVEKGQAALPLHLAHAYPEHEPMAVAFDVSPVARTLRISFPFGDAQTVEMTYAEARAMYDMLQVIFGER